MIYNIEALHYFEKKKKDLIEVNQPEKIIHFDRKVFRDAPTSSSAREELEENSIQI